MSDRMRQLLFLLALLFSMTAGVLLAEASRPVAGEGEPERRVTIHTHVGQDWIKLILKLRR